jgi:hypothetical protein
MRICLVTTTIHVPSVLALYRACDPQVEIIVAGDRGAPHDEIRGVMEPLGNATYLSDDDQERMGTRVSGVIGWRKIQRRNLALLEAIRRRPDAIVTIDDDNIPADRSYFGQIADALGRPFDGLAFRSDDGWFNAGEMLTPRVWHRGFPYSKRGAPHLSATSLVGAEVGVIAGLWLGDPDIDAMTRIHEGPLATDVSVLAQRPVAVELGTYSPFNSQNTAFLAELAPLMAVLVGVGRYDDIWASYIAQRIMRETGHVVTFGPPFVWQERNLQDLFKNLEDEILGMRGTDRFVAALDAAEIEGEDVVGRLRSLYRWLAKSEDVPPAVTELGLAWCDDVEDALG